MESEDLRHLVYESMGTWKGTEMQCPLTRWRFSQRGSARPGGSQGAAEGAKRPAE